MMSFPELALALVLLVVAYTIGFAIYFLAGKLRAYFKLVPPEQAKLILSRAVDFLAIGCFGGLCVFAFGTWNQDDGFERIRKGITATVAAATLFVNGLRPERGWTLVLMWSHILVGYVHLWPK